MNISELSIRRPVMASVLTIIILLFGFIGYSYLGVREYPSVDNPIISVTCSYPGANADVIENQITEPLEQNINGIPGIRSMSSVSSQGQSRITVEFELSVDLETAANDVRDKVSRAQRYLPRDCDPPTVTKADADATPILMVTIQSRRSTTSAACRYGVRNATRCACGSTRPRWPDTALRPWTSRTPSTAKT